jgi:hypothetical protein
MNTYAVGEAHLQALLTSIADESEMMVLAPVATSHRKGLPKTIWCDASLAPDSDIGVQKKKHSLPSGNRTYISLESSL